MQNLVMESARLELMVWIFLSAFVVGVVYGAFLLAGFIFDRPALLRKAHGFAALVLGGFALGYAFLTTGDPAGIQAEISRVESAIRGDCFTAREIGSSHLVMVYTNCSGAGEKGGILMRRASLESFVAEVRSENFSETRAHEKRQIGGY